MFPLLFVVACTTADDGSIPCPTFAQIDSASTQLNFEGFRTWDITVEDLPQTLTLDQPGLAAETLEYEWVAHAGDDVAIGIRYFWRGDPERQGDFIDMYRAVWQTRGTVTTRVEQPDVSWDTHTIHMMMPEETFRQYTAADSFTYSTTYTTTEGTCTDSFSP